MPRRKRSQRLELVVDLARKKREEADRVLLESRTRLETAQRGLQQLEKYLSEYLNASRLEQGQTASASELLTTAAFINRLRGSIKQQKELIEQCKEQHAQVEQWWRQHYAREQAITKLQRSAVNSELQAEEKQLQKQIDQISQNRTSPGI